MSFSGCRNKSDAKILLTDDFEGHTIADFWRYGDKGSGRFEKEAVSITNEYHHSGNQCAKLILKEGFIKQDGGDGNFTERTELDSKTHPFLQHHVRCEFSMPLPL